MTTLNQRRLVYNALVACHERTNKLIEKGFSNSWQHRAAACDQLLVIRETLHSRILDAMQDEFDAKRDAYLVPEMELSL